jgi:hypothetical protein
MAVIKYPGGTGATPVPISSSVTTRHPSWLETEPQWSRVSDVLGGTDAVRANAHAYIPASVDHQQHPDAYDAMIRRTSFTNYTSRALDGLEGLIFRKDPSVTVPYRYDPRLKNINNTGDHINTFSKKVVREVLAFGRVGILVDSLPSDQQNYGSPTSLLPYLSLYTAQNITNWRLRSVDGQVVPDQIVLREFYGEPQEFGSITRNRYRVLELDGESNYRVRLYEQGTDGGEYYLASEFYPTTGSTNGQRYLNRIPFVCINPIDLSMEVRRPPLLDLVDANLSLFLLESEYSTALYYSAQPTPVITGWREDLPATFRFGGGNMWMLPEGCTASILEFKGHGLEPLERALAGKVDSIADLGARLLQNAASGPETAEAARIRQHSQTSVVSSIARTVSDGLQASLEIACKGAMAEGKISFELNQDYIDVMMAPQMLAEIVRTKQAGLMTTKDAVYNIVRGELTEPGRTVDQIVDELQSETPMMVGQPDAMLFQRDRGVDPNDEEE